MDFKLILDIANVESSLNEKKLVAIDCKGRVLQSVAFDENYSFVEGTVEALSTLDQNEKAIKAEFFILRIFDQNLFLFDQDYDLLMILDRAS